MRDRHFYDAAYAYDTNLKMRYLIITMGHLYIQDINDTSGEAGPTIYCPASKFVNNYTFKSVEIKCY